MSYGASNTKGVRRNFTELQPEEALYLLERGTLQIWIQHDTDTDTKSPSDDSLTWSEEEQGFKDCIEMSVMEGFGRFVGQDGLTLERYQVSN